MSGFVLKVIALVTMIIDHTGAAFQPYMDTYYLRVIGRIAFPIFIYLVAEGCRHTRDIKKYMLRLFVFGLISEIPFDLIVFHQTFNNPNLFNWNYQNIYFTLFLGVLTIYLGQIIQKHITNQALSTLAKGVAVILCLWIAIFLVVPDYGWIGVLGVYLIYVQKTQARRAIALAFVVMTIYFVPSMSANLYLVFALIPCALVMFYNGKPGKYRLKWLFYAAYPIHLFLLYIIVNVVYML